MAPASFYVYMLGWGFLGKRLRTLLYCFHQTFPNKIACIFLISKPIKGDLLDPRLQILFTRQNSK
jgi:hypothetical protein